MKKTQKIEKKILTLQGAQGVPLGGPISRLGGRISKNASMMLFVFLQRLPMPSFIQIGPVVSSEQLVMNETVGQIDFFPFFLYFPYLTLILFDFIFGKKFLQSRINR